MTVRRRWRKRCPDAVATPRRSTGLGIWRYRQEGKGGGAAGATSASRRTHQRSSGDATGCDMGHRGVDDMTQRRMVVGGGGGALKSWREGPPQRFELRWRMPDPQMPSDCDRPVTASCKQQQEGAPPPPPPYVGHSDIVCPVTRPDPPEHPHPSRRPLVVPSRDGHDSDRIILVAVGVGGSEGPEMTMTKLLRPSHGKG